MRAALFLIAAAVALTGCAQWHTNYPSRLDEGFASQLRVTSVDVVVPRTLVVSEEQVPAPEADIVWQEPYTGDRYAQVDAIMTEAARRGMANLSGSRDVKLKIVLQRFHALSEFARAWAYDSGVHSIAFTAQFVDAETGEPVFEPVLIRADLAAYSGETSERARQVGETQQVRITRHVAQTIDGWVGTGPDNRGHFWRLGY